MSWLERLKKRKHPGSHPTETTKTVSMGEKGVSVVSVGYVLADIGKINVSKEAANTPPEALPPAPPPPATTADQDRACWPHGPAMNRAEIERMVHRLALFDGRGLTVPEAERLADKLVLRDREEGNRTSCAECHRLDGWSPKTWRCCGPSGQGNTLAGAMLSVLWLSELHRCPGFTAHTGKLPVPVGAVAKPAKPRKPSPPAVQIDRELDRLSLRHHFGCVSCIAAGKRGGTRCPVGLTYNLVAAVQTLPMP